jgi:hypothetical protein
MCTAEEKFFTPLSASEYRLLDVLCTLSIDSVADVSLEELARYAQCSEESIRRALRGLERATLIETTRSKRNLGKYSYSSYKLISPSHKNVGRSGSPSHKSVGLPSHKNVGSTADYIDIDITSNKINKTTSYLQGADAPSGKKKGTIKLVNRWQDDDANLGGFGLFENEIQERNTPKITKRNPATRRARTQADWTPHDVAAEFDDKLRGRLPVMPQPINTREIAAVIGKYRKNSGSNALIELEVMKMFFEDPWLDKAVSDRQIAWIQKRFLKMLSTNFLQAAKNLNMAVANTPDEIDLEPQDEFVYASDGRKFDNSMPGRMAMERYEEKLRRNSGV